MIEGGKIVIPFPQHPNVMMHLDCRTELSRLIQPGEMPDFIAAYRQRLDFLSQHMGEETVHRSWFEVLKKAHGLRSVRFMKFRNLRILYMLEDEKAYLLLAFEERHGHRNTEYSNYIDPALKRLCEKEKML